MKNVVITILVMLVVVLGGFVIYDKVINNNKKNNETIIDNEDENSKDYFSAAAQALVDKYYVSEFTNEFTWNENFKTKFAILAVNADGEKDSIKYSTLNASYKRFFGNDKNVQKSTVNYNGCDSYYYNSSTDSFVKSAGEGCGYASGTVSIYGVKSAKTTGNKLIVNVGYVQISYGSATINGREVNFTDSQIENKEQILNQYLNQLDTYELEFLYEDGQYKLRNVVKK